MSEATAAMPITLAAHGRKRQLHPGEVLLEVGDQVRFFLITAIALAAVHQVLRE
jgi:hypothetical protein